MADFLSFVDHFRSHVAGTPGKTALAYLYGADDSGVEGRRLSYAELDHSARRTAAWLQRRHRVGDRALLLFPAGLEFMEAFLGCLYAGLVPVPAPVPGNDRHQVDRTTRIALDAEVALVLANAGDAGTLRRAFAALPLPGGLDVVALDDARGDAAGWAEPVLRPDALTLLQYTSGSTSEPKGVMVTHANLADNTAEITRQGGVGPDHVTVHWLPHFHDMGLIGMLLHPLRVGATSAQLSPITFLKRPARWLEAMSHWRATHAAAPDFAYDLCARVVTDEQVAGLDLSAVRWLLNGAEPVRASTIARFSRRFAAIGFRPEAFSPCYGMAESTLVVSTSPPETPPILYAADQAALERDELRPATTARSLRVAGCGRPDPARVRIVDPRDHTAAAPGAVGEIWLTGPSVAAGYWRRPDVNEEIFAARMADGSGPYLRTGDLGGLIDGELFITGRLKDVLIVHGRNIYPQDIEHVVRDSHPALAAGTGVAFAVSRPGDLEHIVVVHEIKKALLDGLSPEELIARIKVAVVKGFDVPTPSVALVNRGGVQRTTSGKVQRRLMSSLFLQGRLSTVHEELTPAVQALREPAGEPAPTA